MKHSACKYEIFSISVKYLAHGRIMVKTAALYSRKYIAQLSSEGYQEGLLGMQGYAVKQLGPMGPLGI